MPYYLDHSLFTDTRLPHITVVGCGGTGAFAADALCRLFTGREATIVLVDHDRVEPHNLLRQAFYPGDVGRFKSQVLAERLARNYSRTIGYSVYPFRAMDDGFNGRTYIGFPRYAPCLIIGCVDNAAARAEIANSLQYGEGRWWVDAGNGSNWGQVLVGNQSDVNQFHNAFDEDTCYVLPTPTLQRPDLLTAIPETPPDIDCAAALDLTDLDPTINYMMASLLMQVVRRMVAGTCPFMGLYLDMEQGTVVPNYATPEAVSRIVGAPVEALITVRGEELWCPECGQRHR